MKSITDLVPVEWQNRRVLTTAQLADAYKCSVDQIKVNFNANKKHYKEGLHYFKLEGAALAAFKASLVTDNSLIVSPMTRTLYLWTVAGIFLHCKILNTPHAWELFSQIGERISIKNPELLDEIIFGNIKRPDPRPDLACVYALELDNNFVKIGMSNNVDSRQGSIRRKLKMNTLRTYQTDFMPRQKANQIEKSCHKFFRDKLAYRHEYFNITFAEACAIINVLATDTTEPIESKLNIATVNLSAAEKSE